MACRYKDAVIAHVARIVIDSSDEKSVDKTVIGESFASSRFFSYDGEKTIFYYDINVVNINEIFKAFKKCSVLEVRKLTQILYQGKVFSKKINPTKRFEELLAEVEEGGVEMALEVDRITSPIAEYLEKFKRCFMPNEPKKPTSTISCRYSIYGKLETIQQEGLTETVFKTYEGYVCMTDEQKKIFEFIEEANGIQIVEKTALKAFNKLKEEGAYLPKSCFVTKVQGGMNIDRIEQYWSVYCPLGGFIKIDEEEGV